MYYQAKENSSAYNYIKETIKMREDAFQRYIKRVEEISGIKKIHSFRGIMPNSGLIGRYVIQIILCSSSDVENLDLKNWNCKENDDGSFSLTPNKRTKKGKAIYKALDSCEALPNFIEVSNALHLPIPKSVSFSLPAIFFRNNNALLYCDNNIDADKLNEDLFEITRSTFEKIMAIK